MYLSGIEWDNLCKILSTALHWDGIFREGIKKALLFNRKRTEDALKELETAGKRVKLWVLYVQMEWTDPPIKQIRYIVTKKPDRFKRLLASNEKLLACVPKRVRVRATPEIMNGIGNACSKVLGLNEAVKRFGKAEILTEYGANFARRMWNRCHLFWRRSVGARKAAWRRKGYIAEFEEAPDLRDASYHEDAKLLYDLEEVKLVEGSSHGR